MPDTQTLKRARADKAQGKAASTQAGEFVREELHHIREGKHGARSAKQAIAIGLSKARRAGVKLGKRKTGSTRTTHKTARVSPARSKATTAALKKEGRAAASRSALSRHAHQAASRRTAAQRSASAKKAAKTRART